MFSPGWAAPPQSLIQSLERKKHPAVTLNLQRTKRIHPNALLTPAVPVVVRQCEEFKINLMRDITKKRLPAFNGQWAFLFITLLLFSELPAWD